MASLKRGHQLEICMIRRGQPWESWGRVHRREKSWLGLCGWGKASERGRAGESCQVMCGRGKGLVLYSKQMRRLRRGFNREVRICLLFKGARGRSLRAGVHR